MEDLRKVVQKAIHDAIFLHALDPAVLSRLNTSEGYAAVEGIVFGIRGKLIEP